MANGINFVTSNPGFKGRGLDISKQTAPGQTAIKDVGDPKTKARTVFAFDDANPNGQGFPGVGSQGNGYKPFRISGG